MRKIIISSLLLIIQFVYANEMPKSIDYFTKKGIEVKLVKLQDTRVINLKLSNGQEILAGYSGIKFKTLYEWKEKQKQTGEVQILLLNYTNKNGLEVRDQQSKIHFKLIGRIHEHLIDMAMKDCMGEFYSTLGMLSCQSLALTAWDFELNRAYRSLGGNKNTSLKEAQIAWIKYRDAQAKLIQEEYGSREGTLWRVISMSHIVDITKTQANLLKEMDSKFP